MCSFQYLNLFKVAIKLWNLFLVSFVAIFNNICAGQYSFMCSHNLQSKTWTSSFKHRLRARLPTIHSIPEEPNEAPYIYFLFHKPSYSDLHSCLERNTISMSFSCQKYNLQKSMVYYVFQTWCKTPMLGWKLPKNVTRGLVRWSETKPFSKQLMFHI